jgi:hypothetical protein
VTNERPDLCARCGGSCCRTRPGVEAPERFLAAPDPAAALAEALASGDWVLARQVGAAWVDGVPPPDEERWRVVRVPRPATRAERAAGAVAPGPDPSPCVFLGEAGCRLPFADRPRMCRDLEPWANGECVPAWDLPEAARAWAPRQALVEDALRRLA